ncbi:uncharacterized protein PGTG_12380 [Puccinia graminis f. sp. tritici CRL 75-36-700-3]|uniref:CCHC-type domain-containing protein n=1 Tax=Puccinia graminis f. sp. tritici (strain CRL 75-36-700-3 / race SCCL) TaxID=418459 RepID=E3KQ49_PUCGT|nr:uncharacterized protein PGTG_12380 [Puccinia graminis f. sp. tritici CRL 75-36-700-3]EFP86424.2 hypothetical protein PGTG_12380 [Puccinia graminis f. sp. tritici CRL 75-36-700-3]
MDGDDVLTHINTMAKEYNCLNSLVTTDKPLTVADVHSAALLSSIPDDWMGCVSHLMNQEGVSTESIVLALKNEHTRRHSQNEVSVSISSTKTKPNNGKRPGDRNKKRHCDFCNADGHDLNNCNNTRQILDEHKANQKSQTNSKDQDRQQTQSGKPAARAGRTSAVTLGGHSHTYDDDVESDYSGSEVKFTAGNAVASLSVSNFYSGTVLHWVKGKGAETG